MNFIDRNLNWPNESYFLHGSTIGLLVVVYGVVVVLVVVVVLLVVVCGGGGGGGCVVGGGGGRMTSVVSLNKKLASLLSRYDWILESSIFLEFCRSHWSDLSKASNETYPSKNLRCIGIVTIAAFIDCQTISRILLLIPLTWFTPSYSAKHLFNGTSLVLDILEGPA